MIVLRFKKKKKKMYIALHHFVLVCFHANCHCLSVEVTIFNAMSTEDEGISTALRIEEVMHSNKKNKIKNGPPWAPFGFSQ